MPPTLARAWIDDAQAEWDREARTYGPDEDDDDGETDDEAPTQEIVVVPLTPAACGLLTLAQHEAIDDLRDVYPELVVDGSRVWLPGARINPATGCRLVLPHLPPFEVVDVTGLVPGTWISLEHPALTGA